MIVDVHTHLPTHEGHVPADEERFNAILRPDKSVPRINSVDDYLKEMEPVDKVFVFDIARRSVESTSTRSVTSCP